MPAAVFKWCSPGRGVHSCCGGPATCTGCQGLVEGCSADILAPLVCECHREAICLPRDSSLQQGSTALGPPRGPHAAWTRRLQRANTSIKVSHISWPGGQKPSHLGCRAVTHGACKTCCMKDDDEVGSLQRDFGRAQRVMVLIALSGRQRPDQWAWQRCSSPGKAAHGVAAGSVGGLQGRAS